MKLAKIYIMIFLVTTFSLLGADCGGKKSNVFIEVDTTTNNVIPKDDFEKVEKNLKRFGTTFKLLSNTIPKPDRFRFFINRLPLSVVVVYVASDGAETDGPTLTSQTEQPCMTFCSLDNYNAQTLKIYEYKNGSKDKLIVNVNKDMGTTDFIYNGTEYTVRRYYNNDSRAITSAEHLIGVEIMNK